MFSLWGVGKEGLKCKDLIIGVLSAEFPLTAKEVHRKIADDYKVSYQAVHKFVKELVQEGVLVELSKKYLINLRWLNRLNDFSSKVRSNYLNIKELDYSHSKPKSSLEVIDKYRTNLLEELKDMENKPYLNVEFAPLNENSTRESLAVKKHILSIITENRFNPLLILGDSGSGKTVLASKIAFEYGKRSRLVPVIISLSTYDNEELLELVRTELCRISKEDIAESMVELLLKEGSFIILLDGLNEAEREEDALRSINKFTSGDLKNNQFVVTCRTHNDPKKKLPFTSFRILPLSRSMIEFIAAQKNKKHVLKELNRCKKLFSLCRNPLIFSMLMELKTKSKVDKKADIYSYFINEYLGKEIKNSRKKDTMINDIIRLLQKLAFSMSTKDIASMEHARAYKIIERNAKKNQISKTYLDELISVMFSSGFIKRTNSKEIEFMHQSFQEYFAALELNSKEALKRISDVKWHDTLIFYSDLTNDLPVFLKKVYSRFSKTNDYSYLFLAAKCCIGKNTAEKGSIVGSLLEAYNLPDSEFYRHWHELRQVFQSWHDKEISNRLKEFFLLSSGNISPRMVNILHHSDEILLSSDSRIEFLEKIMKTTKNRHLLYSIVEVMGFRKNTNVIGNLIKFLSSDDPILRCQTVWSLEQMKEKALFAMQKRAKNPEEYIKQIKKEAVNELKKLIEHEDDYIKGHALIELSRINSKEAMPFITKFLDEKPFLRYHATYAMQNIEDSDFIFTYLDKKDGAIA